MNTRKSDDKRLVGDSGLDGREDRILENFIESFGTIDAGSCNDSCVRRSDRYERDDLSRFWDDLLARSRHV
jgi:hypothetical protein